MRDVGRYSGKPFLRLLECYVLRAIGELDPAQQSALGAMAPNLRTAYKLPGDWHQIVAAVMNFPADMPDVIHEMWTRNQALARGKGLQLSPEVFARRFVDENFPG